MKGTVKWFNAKKGLVSSLTRQEKMYSYISQHFRWTASRFLMRAKRLSSMLLTEKRDHRLLTLLSLVNCRQQTDVIFMA